MSRALGALVILGLVVACGSATKKPKGAGDTPKLAASNFTAPPGVELVSACVPSGPELCFNAIDDNCNGVIDEGCGVATGLLQFTVAWSESAADLDLAVTVPSGDRISDAVRSSSVGFRLDHDCPSDGCGGQNIENVFYEGNEPPRGKYEVEVKLADPHGADPPIKARLGARVGSRTYGADIVLSRVDEKKTFTFELPK